MRVSQGTGAMFYRCGGQSHVKFFQVFVYKIVKISTLLTELLKNTNVIAFLKHGVLFSYCYFDQV